MYIFQVETFQAIFKLFVFSSESRFCVQLNLILLINSSFHKKGQKTRKLILWMALWLLRDASFFFGYPFHSIAGQRSTLFSHDDEASLQSAQWCQNFYEVEFQIILQFNEIFNIFLILQSEIKTKKISQAIKVKI